jgi:hypothetical protein
VSQTPPHLASRGDGRCRRPRLQVIAEQWTEGSGAEEKGFILPIAVTSAVCVALADVSKLGWGWGKERVGRRVVMLAEMRMKISIG